MGISIRKTEQDVAYATAAAITALRRDATIVGSRFHAGTIDTRTGGFQAPVATPETIAAANATNLATSITLVNAIFSLLRRHVADSVAVHKAADPTAVAALAAGAFVDTTTGTIGQVQTLANLCKSSYEAHRVQSGIHFTNDSTNTIAAADASDQTSANTLLNEMKTDINAHMASAVAGFALNLVSP